MRSSVLVLIASLTTSTGLAQVLTPVPPAPAPLPDYTPPPPPPTPPAPAVEPPTPAPNLITMNGDRIVVLSEPPEFAAAKAIKLDAPKAAQLAALINDRQAKLDAMIIASPAKAAELYAKLPGTDTMDMNQMASFPSLFKGFSVTPNALDALRGASIFTPGQLEAIASANTAYRQALAEEAKKVSAGDINGTMLHAARAQIKIVASEFTAAMSRLVTQVTSNWAKVGNNVSAPDAEKLNAVMAGADQAAKNAAFVTALSTMPPEASAKILSLFALQPVASAAPATPSAPATPAAPATPPAPATPK